MIFKAHATDLATILPFRELFLQENNFQIRYNACHERGWSDAYLLTVDGVVVGYGSVKGQEINERNTIFEFYVLPTYRKWASPCFQALVAASDVALIECQSNDLLLSFMLYEFAQGIRSEVILFADHHNTNYQMPELLFRPTQEQDYRTGYKTKDLGSYVLEWEGELVATGGYLLHYNMPFADVYMDVRDTQRRRGFGSFIVQELKKVCYQHQRVPAARCNIQNQASKATLLKAGFTVAGYMLLGKVKKK
ncbi:MAG: GNAT family N-acetyltransferase [Saprospiraceae bacterium]